ncbi:gamma-glutamyltranspeptidase [Legionella spiritensis]|uniref:Glutathione hydrolase proenzyme n=2 Tax=Legionella spiritensis TaxID=452 RepID=A0A0W0Z6A0_LEGSP|nr:gamma-glutamyltranspeptidase [Legionella spiritensis]SNV47770.1 gamma-glutamyltranspeptidase [Legionella spiritensis]
MTRRWLFILTGLMFGCAVASQPGTIHEYPPGYAVASAHPLATDAGLEILAAGGNAFDAVVAVSAALAVVEPYHSGLGGGGFWLLHRAKDKKNIVIDGREVAPLRARKDMYLDKDGKPVPGLSLNGGLAAAIPGEPAALAYIAEHYGRLPLAKSLAPAIRLAENGFPIDQQFYYFSTMDDRLQQLRRFPATVKIFLHNGNPYQRGEWLLQPDLAKTLRSLAEKGHAGFYRGEVAKRLVKGVQEAGGIWIMDDLARYQVKVREPLVGAFHNMLIVTTPPPSAGGVSLLIMLNILANYPLQTFSEVMRIHYVVEAMRLAYWQRMEILADPDFVKLPVERLISAGYAAKLRAFISPDKATPSTSFQGKNPVNDDSHTTHISILDAQGNRVAATLSINFIFGSSVVAEGTGVLLNDEMDDFAIKTGESNVFGIVGSDANAIEPGKRPLSSMTPTFLEMPGRVAILGTPGGSRIPTMVLLASLVFSDYKGAISMVSRMRFHHQYLPDVLQFEPETFSPKLQGKLQDMGYHLMALKQYFGDMQAITWDKWSNIITAASDPRHIGRATAVTKNEGNYGVRY